ncbi:MAG: hypothetical protein V3U96_10985 [Paracoccaceae bacterium]
MSLNDSIVELLKRVRGTSAKAETTSTRELKAGSGPLRLAAILNEIEETVLPRKLTFRLGDDAHIVMDVANGRLMRMLEVKPDSVVGPNQEIFSARDDKKKAEQVTAFRAFLTTFAQMNGPMEVTSGPPKTEYSAAEVGYTAPELRKACQDFEFPGDAPEPAEPDKKAAAKTPAKKSATKKPAAKKASAKKPATKPRKAATAAQASASIAAFFDACEPLSENIFLMSGKGKVDRHSGGTSAQKDWQSAAGDVASDLAQWIKATSNALGPSQLIVLKSPRLDNQSVCFATEANHTVVAVFNNADLARVLSAASNTLNWGVVR